LRGAFGNLSPPRAKAAVVVAPHRANGTRWLSGA